MLIRFTISLARAMARNVLMATLALTVASSGVTHAATLISNYPLQTPPASYALALNLPSFGYGILMGSQAYHLTSATFQLQTDAGVVLHLALYNDNGSGLPDALQAVSFGDLIGGGSTPGIPMTFTPTSAFTLAANTAYWFVISHSPGQVRHFGDNPGVIATGPGATFAGYTRSLTSSVPDSVYPGLPKPTFRLDGDIVTGTPEPGTILLTLIGGVWLLRKAMG